MKYVLYIVIIFSLLLSGCSEPLDPSIAPWENGIDENFKPFSSKKTSHLFNSDGGNLFLTNSDINISDAAIFISEGTLFEDHLFSIERKNNNDAIVQKYNSISSMILISPVFELSSNAEKFDKPVKIQIPFKPLTLPYKKNEVEVELNEIQKDIGHIHPELLYYHNEIWHSPKDQIIDHTNNTITAYVDHFTAFAVHCPVWPAYGKDKDISIDHLNIKKENNSIFIDLSTNAMGKYPWKSFSEFSNFDHTEFELITFIKLMKEENKKIPNIILEKHYYNTILINKYKGMEFSFDNEAVFGSWNFLPPINSAWFGFNGFIGPFESKNHHGIHKYLITTAFNSKKEQISSPFFKKCELSDNAVITNNSIRNDLNDELFSINDNFIDISFLSPEESNNYYFDIINCWVWAGKEKYVRSISEKFYIEELTHKIKDLKIISTEYGITEKPSHLKVTEISSDKLTFTWDHSFNCLGYYIYINGLEYSNTTENSFTVKNLTGSTEYEISVAAFMNNGNMIFSDPLNVITALPNNAPEITYINIENMNNDIGISYFLQDPDDDHCSIELLYTTDNGVNWYKTLNITGITSDIPANKKYFLQWNAAKDIAEIQENVKIKIIPKDEKDSGNAFESEFFSVNIPSVNDISISENSADINISFILTNTADNISFYFSTDSGVNWLKINSIDGTTENVLSGINNFIWHSDDDIFEDVSDAQIKIIPYYNVNKQGNLNISESFSVLNKDNIVIFSDNAIHTKISSITSVPVNNIRNTDLLNITSFNGNSLNISNIKGLDHCININDLNLSQNKIFDITYIKNFKHLNYLDLSNNRISDISPLIENSHFVSPLIIDLRGNNLSDTVDQSNINILKNRGVTVIY